MTSLQFFGTRGWVFGLRFIYTQWMHFTFNQFKYVHLKFSYSISYCVSAMEFANYSWVHVCIKRPLNELAHQKRYNVESDKTTFGFNKKKTAPSFSIHLKIIQFSLSIYKRFAENFITWKNASSLNARFTKSECIFLKVVWGGICQVWHRMSLEAEKCTQLFCAMVI